MTVDIIPIVFVLFFSSVHIYYTVRRVIFSKRKCKINIAKLAVCIVFGMIFAFFTIVVALEGSSRHIVLGISFCGVALAFTCVAISEFFEKSF